MKFDQLGLHPAIGQRCLALGFENPTPIQEQAIPTILDGSDLIATAETGTGKTAAFLLPILNKIGRPRGKQDRKTSVLILTPTRELATQIDAACRSLANDAIKCASIIGGVGYGPQIEKLRRDPHIIIATPGRLLDHIEQGTADLSTITTLILDEADRMLDMGFLPAIKRIVKMVADERQTLLFSATMSPEIDKIARTMMNDPEYISVSPPNRASVNVRQMAYPIAAHSKMPLLLELLETDKLERVLVFTRTKRGADRVAHILEKRDHSSNRIHGDRSQSQRQAALNAFRAGHANVLVATDVAARGIDIDSVGHVINYDIPEAPEDYVHRIGRTGRAGREGRAITLFTMAEEHSMRAIEKLTGQEVERIIREDLGGYASTSSAAAGAGAGASGVGSRSRGRSSRPRRRR